MKYMMITVLFILLAGCQFSENITPKNSPNNNLETQNKCQEFTEQDKKILSTSVYNIITNDLCFLKNEKDCKIADKCYSCENTIVDNFNCQCDISGNFWNCKKNNLDRHFYSIIEEPCIQRKEKKCTLFPDPTRTDCLDYDSQSGKEVKRRVEFDTLGYHCICDPRSAVCDFSEGKFLCHHKSENGYKTSDETPNFDTYFCELQNKK